MFYITREGVLAQEGESAYYLLQKDIEFLAKDEKSRIELLNSLKEEGILVSTAIESGVREIHLDKLLECGTGIHSRL